MLANVWDVVSAKTVAAVEGVRALATASHSIAASLGYEDREKISLDEHLAVVERIVAAVGLPPRQAGGAAGGSPMWRS